jgi:hypothetical protein
MGISLKIGWEKIDEYLRESRGHHADQRQLTLSHAHIDTKGIKTKKYKDYDIQKIIFNHCADALRRKRRMGYRSYQRHCRRKCEL